MSVNYLWYLHFVGIFLLQSAVQSQHVQSIPKASFPSSALCSHSAVQSESVKTAQSEKIVKCCLESSFLFVAIFDMCVCFILNFAPLPLKTMAFFSPQRDFVLTLPIQLPNIDI